MEKQFFVLRFYFLSFFPMAFCSICKWKRGLRSFTVFIFIFSTDSGFCVVHILGARAQSISVFSSLILQFDNSRFFSFFFLFALINHLNGVSLIYLFIYFACSASASTAIQQHASARHDVGEGANLDVATKFIFGGFWHSFRVSQRKCHH